MPGRQDATSATVATGPQGPRARIEAGGYVAEIAEVGASLAMLQDDLGPLVLPVPEEMIRPGLAGAVLAPWPNRLRDGRYVFEGVEHRLPLNEPERGTAAHGLVCWDRWHLLRHEAGGPAAETARAEFACAPPPRPGYPFRLRISVGYVVGGDGLSVRIEARNLGTGRAPYAVAWHPYLVAPTGGPDDWTLDVPAESFLQTDPVRLLPVGAQAVTGSSEDFRGGRSLAGESHDVALGGLPESARIRLTDGTGHGVRLRTDAGVRWIQAYTEGPGDGAGRRRAVAVEPMSAPADAFNSGQDLVVLEPGGQHVMTCRLDRI